MFGNWTDFDLITRSCITRELAGELSTLQVASQSFPQVFLVVLLQIAPGNVVPSSHICGWCSHCVFKSHSELKKRFASQDSSERVTFPGLPQKPFHPTVYLRAPYMLTEESHAEGPVLFHRPQGQRLYLLWWLPPGLRGEARKRFLSEENLVSATTLGTDNLW